MIISILRNALITVSLFVFALLIHFHLAFKRRSKGLPLPPGPRGLPFIGSTPEMMDVFTMKPWVRFAKWKDESGATDLLGVQTINQYHIFIMKAQAAVDLLEKRGALYAGRAPAVFGNELVNKEMILASCGDPERVKRLRKLLHEQFSHVGAEIFQELQLEECVLMLKDFLKRPEEADCVFHESMKRLVFKSTYGKSTSFSDEELWHHVRHSMSERRQPTLAPLMNPFPWLKYWPSWLPGGEFHKMAEEYHQEDCAIWERVRDDVKRGMEDGTISPNSCILSRIYTTDAHRRYGFSEREIAFVAANLFTAGGDLPEITFRVWTAAMLHFPHILKKAQAEIDRVVGRDRIPNFEDKNGLPYTRAVILETQRWRPLTAIGVGHSNLKDDVYNGVFIPKGSIIYPNIHAMSQDKEMYPRPEQFLPERFLSDDGKTLNRKREIASFGYGRRLCSAMHFAEATLFMWITSMTWAFDIEAPFGDDGLQILPDIDMNNWEGDLPCRPQEFRAIFKPRLRIDSWKQDCGR